MPYIGNRPADPTEADNFVVDNFTAGVGFTAGSSTTVTLSGVPATENAIIVTMDGVTQHHDTYSVSGTTLTFDTAIPSGVSNIEVQFYIKAIFTTVAGLTIDNSQNATFAGAVSMGPGDWPTTTIGQSAGRAAVLNDTQGILVVADMGATAGATKAGAIVLGGRNTTGTPNLAYAQIKGAKASGSGTWGSTLALSTQTTGATIVDALTIDQNQNATFAGDVYLDGDLLEIEQGAAGGDPRLHFLITATAEYSMGIDNSDSDKFKISSGSTVDSGTILTLDRSDASATFAGQVGVGSAAESNKKFQVYQSSASANQLISELRHSGATSPLGVQIYFSGAAPDDNTQWFINCADTGATRLTVWSDGDLANHDGTYGTLSDRFYKTDIVDARDYWDDWKSVSFKTFTKGGKKQFGVIADELEQVFPGLVHKSPDENHPDGESQWVDTMNLNHIGGRVVQELQARVEALEAQLATLSSN